MRCSFSQTPELSEPLFELLDAVFPGLREAVRNLRPLGVRWESCSTPYVHFEGERPVAHIGVIALPLVLLGQHLTVGSLHAVATHPEFRRRGYYRRLMEEVLQDCEGRYETLILSTDNPAIYEPFGFRVLGEHLFTVPCRSPGGAGGTRPLALADADDLALLNRLLDTRQPVSNVVGATDAKDVFLFNEARHPLHYVPDLDVVLCMELQGERLVLFDVVGPRIPPLVGLLARIPQPVAEVAMCFAADRLAAGARATPHVLDHDGPSYLMARGPFAAEGLPFTLPRSARA